MAIKSMSNISISDITLMKGDLHHEQSVKKNSG